MTNLHNAIAVLRDGVLRLEGYPSEEPISNHYGQPYEFQSAYCEYCEWLASKVSYVFADQVEAKKAITKFLSVRSYPGEYPLHPELLHRIEIVDGQAVLKGEEKRDDLSLFGNYLVINGIKLTDSNNVEETIQTFLKSDYYLTRKNK